MSAKDLAERGESGGYILVDFDRTLATYTSWNENGERLGAPVPVMVERVKRWLSLGIDVRIFTARASRQDPVELRRIKAWCELYIGKELPVQNWKDFGCVAIWDDLAITVEANTGWRLTTQKSGEDPLDFEEELEFLDSSRT